MDDELEDEVDKELRGTGTDEDVKELMKTHDLDKEEAEHVRDIIEETGLDEEEAVEFKDEIDL